MLDMSDMETGLWGDDPRMETLCLLTKNNDDKQSVIIKPPSKKVPYKAVHLPVLAEVLDQPVLLHDPYSVDGEGIWIVIRDPLILTPEPGVVKQHRIREI